MQNNKFLILNFRKNIIPISILLFTISLLLFPNTNLYYAKQNLIVWSTCLVPSIFPFLVISEILQHTNLLSLFATITKKIMKPVFNIAPIGSFIVVIGFISGYPVGAKTICELYKKHQLSKYDSERLLSFTNTSSPLFILGTIGSSLYSNNLIGLLLLISHFLSAITVGIIFKFWKKDKTYSSNFNNQISITNKISLSNFSDILSNSIKHSISTVLMIGGFIIIFSTICSVLNASKIFYLISCIISPIFKYFNINNEFIIPILNGFLEITNGINLISHIFVKDLSTNILFTSFLLGLSGLSVFLQILSFVTKTDLSIKPFIYGKFLNSIFSVIYTFILMTIFPFFNFNL